VVDIVCGVHARIRESDFAGVDRSRAVTRSGDVTGAGVLGPSSHARVSSPDPMTASAASDE